MLANSLAHRSHIEYRNAAAATTVAHVLQVAWRRRRPTTRRVPVSGLGDSSPSSARSRIRVPSRTTRDNADSVDTERVRGVSGRAAAREAAAAPRLPRDAPPSNPARAAFLPLASLGRGRRHARSGRLLPGHADDRLIGVVESRRLPEGRRYRSRRPHELGEVGVRHGNGRDAKGIEPYLVNGTLGRRSRGIAHEERAGRHRDEVHEDIMRPMKTADRMGRLGTESAFEVLARPGARAAGQAVVPLDIGEPTRHPPI